MDLFDTLMKEYHDLEAVLQGLAEKGFIIQAEGEYWFLTDKGNEFCEKENKR